MLALKRDTPEARDRTTGGTDGTGGTGSGRRSRRHSRDSQDSQHQDFNGIGGLPALQQLHNLAVWIRKSNHSDLWDLAVGLRLGLDNDTRWNSWYLIIGRALKKRSQIIEFLVDHEAALGSIRLTSQDWDLLNKAYQFLQPFYGATLYAEGDKSSLGQSLVLMDVLLRHYEQQKV